MKRLLLASVGLIALGIAVPASAADLGVRRGPAVAPVAVAPIYNWTGFYIGAHIGWGSVELNSTLLVDIPPFLTGTSFGGTQDGFLGGGQAGFNWQTGAWVLGIEGQISWTDISESATITLGGLTSTSTSSVDWLGTLAARVGVASANWLFYVKGGLAFLDWSVSNTILGGFGTVSAGDTEWGWMVGVGIEYGFTPNWSAKIEYNYMDFDVDRTSFLGTPLFDHDLTAHVVKFGINYRFGGKAPGPVVARY